MSETRKKMNLALKEYVIPELRERGFKGCFPHFCRLKEDQTDLLTFQFSRWGGEFVVEVAIGPSEPFVAHWGKRIEPKKMTAHNIGDRLRLGPKKEGECDYWFKYEGLGKKSYKKVSKMVITHIDSEAETYWNQEHNKSAFEITGTGGAID